MRIGSCEVIHRDFLTAGNMKILKDNNVNYKWIYTYDYAPDSVWEPWRNEVYEKVQANDAKYAESVWIENEAEAVATRVCSNADSGTEATSGVSNKEDSTYLTNERLTYILLADSHFTYNGTWEDTVTSMKMVGDDLSKKGIRLDGIIHLGDLTDGLLSQKKTREVEDRCIEDMQVILCNQSSRHGLQIEDSDLFVGSNRSMNDKVPLYLTPGNHDYNYFRGNPEIKYPTTPQYYIDEPEAKLRLIFIDSFDPKEELRYGFTEYCIHWVDAVLNMMPQDYVAIIFSHVPPIKQLHAWSDWIRNSHILMPVLDKYADRILAYINGHSHCDHLFNDLHNGQFPIISINCAKCEYFLEHKPEGAVVPYRRLGERTQESFDIMQVDTEKREIYFTRFGAGQDRVVRNHKAYWASS